MPLTFRPWLSGRLEWVCSVVFFSEIPSLRPAVAAESADPEKRLDLMDSAVMREGTPRPRADKAVVAG